MRTLTAFQASDPLITLRHVGPDEGSRQRATLRPHDAYFSVAKPRGLFHESRRPSLFERVHYLKSLARSNTGRADLPSAKWT